eukprot:1157334-Pelagomonas_calceolata.AAC.2
MGALGIKEDPAFVYKQGAFSQQLERILPLSEAGLHSSLKEPCLSVTSKAELRSSLKWPCLFVTSKAELRSSLKGLCLRDTSEGGSRSNLDWFQTLVLKIAVHSFHFGALQA